MSRASTDVKTNEKGVTEAEAICDVVTRLNIRFGASKSPDLQACLKQTSAIE